MSPTDARRELYQMQTALGSAGYVDYIWQARDQQAPKASNGWPFTRAVQVSTVVKLKRGK